MKKHILTLVLTAFVGLLLLAMVVKRVVTSPYKISIQNQLELLQSNEHSFSLAEYYEALQLKETDILLVDIRTPEEYEKNHLPNAINIPLREITSDTYAEYINNNPRLTKVIYGNKEVDAVNALSILFTHGFTKNFKYLRGGFALANKYVIQKPTPSFFFYSDEQARFNYSKLMPAGSPINGATNTADVDIEEPAAPRGGC